MFSDIYNKELADDLELNSLLYRRVIRTFLTHYSEPINLNILATKVKASKFFICRDFKRECGITPMKWLWTFRTLLSLELIKSAPDWKLIDIAFICGFRSCAHYTRCVKNIMGITPSRIKQNIHSIRTLEPKHPQYDASSDPEVLATNTVFINTIAKLTSKHLSLM